MEKEQYAELEMEVIAFETEDVIVTSGGNDGDGNMGSSSIPL